MFITLSFVIFNLYILENGEQKQPTFVYENSILIDKVKSITSCAISHFCKSLVFLFFSYDRSFVPVTQTRIDTSYSKHSEQCRCCIKIDLGCVVQLSNLGILSNELSGKFINNQNDKPF